MGGATTVTKSLKRAVNIIGNISIVCISLPTVTSNLIISHGSVFNSTCTVIGERIKTRVSAVTMIHSNETRMHGCVQCVISEIFLYSMFQ